VMTKATPKLIPASGATALGSVMDTRQLETGPLART
jgi:hypothetical protein